MHQVVLRDVVELRLAKVVPMALVLKILNIIDVRINIGSWESHFLELFEGRSDTVLINYATKFTHQSIEFVVVVTLFLLRVASIVNANLFVGVIKLPVLVLILLVKVNYEERVLEVDKEVPHVGHLLGLLLVRDDVEVGVSVFVRSVDLIFQLLLIVATGNVLDA